MSEKRTLYQDLGNEGRKIRLLRLKGGTGRDLEGELIHTSLDDEKLQYEAVSYTWGTSRKADTIDLDGTKLPITLNLSLLLRDLRHVHHSRVLWVDAICINQEDNEERGQQVQMMKTIFTHAECALFCVGRPTEMTDFFLTFLQAFQDEVSREDRAHGENQSRTAWNTIHTRFEESHFSVNHRLQRGLEYIFEQPWFQRVWILQEVANAPAALLQIGTKAIPTHVFTASPDLLGLQPQKHCQAVLDLMPGPLRKPLATGSDLFSLLQIFRLAEATEEHDKVFALLGMCTDPRTNLTLQPNYESSADDVIRKTISHICHCDTQSIKEIPYTSIRQLLTDLENIDTTILLELLLANDEKNALALFDSRRAYVRVTAYMMIAAAKNGNAAVFPLLISAGGDINTKDSKGVSALTWASRLGHEDIVQLLLREGAEVNIESNQSQTALFLAARGGHEAIVRLLLEKGAKVNVKHLSSGLTPLMVAAKNGHGAIARLLVQGGANIEDVGARRQTSLLFAAEDGHDAVVKLLLDSGANVNAKGHNGQTALTLAVEKGHEPTIRLLLESGAQVNLRKRVVQTPVSYAAERGNEAIVRLLIDKGADVNLVDVSGQTPLLCASRGGSLATVRLLLEAGASVNDQDKESHETALLWASRRGHETIVLLLVENGAEVDISNYRNETALSVAAKEAHDGVARLLLDRGAQVDYKDKYGRTPLLLASERGHDTIIKILLENGADVGTTEDHHQTPLLVAAKGGHYSTVRLLHEHGAAVNYKDYYEQTALLLAVKERHEAVARFLLEKGASANVKNQYGATPLLLAVRWGHEAIVRALIDAGAKVDVKDHRGATPLSVAAIGKREAIIQMLQEASLRKANDMGANE